MLLIIHRYSKNNKITSDFIAEKMGIDPVTVRRRLGELKKAGLVRIAPRKEKEGTTLAKTLEKITLQDIFEAAEPDMKGEVCTSTTKLANCTMSGVCANEVIGECIDAGMDALRKTLESITLSEVYVRLEEKEAEHAE